VKEAWLRGRIVGEVAKVMRESPYAFLYEEAARLLKEVAPAELRPEDIPPDRRDQLTGLLGLGIRGVLAQLTGPVPDELAAFAKVVERATAVAETATDRELLAPLAAEWIARLASFYPHPTAARALDILIESAGEEGIESAAPAIRTLLDAAFEDDRAAGLLRPCRKALVQLGHLDADDLWAGLTTEDYSLVRLLCDLDEPDLWRRLLDRLTDPRTHPVHWDSITDELGDLRAPEMVEPVLEVLGDESVSWPIRWLLTETLDTFDTRAALLDLLDRDGLHHLVRLGVAATLVAQGHQECVPTLLDAVRGDVLPHSARTRWSADSFSYREVFTNPLGRVLTVLSGSPDPAVRSVLLTCFDLAIATKPPTSHHPALPARARQLVSALQKLAAKEITHRLLSLQQSIEPIQGWKYSTPLTSLSFAVAPELSARTLACLRTMTLPAAAGRDLGQLLHTISRQADDADTVTELVAILKERDPLWHPESVLAALQKVSRRARVRITPDGRIQE
jgi:hypothetical protein